jgi:hypothetical protein
MALIKPKHWINVPDGSELFAKATGTSDNFSIDMTVQSTGDDDTVVNHAKIVAGARIKLHSPNRYSITIRINFAGIPSPTVSFEARITKPGGAQHGTDYKFTVSDSTGSHDEALIGIVTMGGGAH